MIEPLAALMDPENAPARHGEWHPAHRPMGEESVILDDTDGCSLFVDPWEVAVLVNRAVNEAEAIGRAALPVPARSDALLADIDLALDAFDPMSPGWPDFGKSLAGLDALRRLRAALREGETPE